MRWRQGSPRWPLAINEFDLSEFSFLPSLRRASTFAPPCMCAGREQEGEGCYLPSGWATTRGSYSNFMKQVYRENPSRMAQVITRRGHRRVIARRDCSLTRRGRRARLSGRVEAQNGDSG